MAAALALFYLALARAGIQDIRAWIGRLRNPKPERRQAWVDDLYGEHHQAERAKYAGIIRIHGGVCMERECISATRHIEPGALWHLAHDHAAGGPYDYLGPAHPECNEYEARGRGVTWDGQVSAESHDPWAPSSPEAPEADEFGWAELAQLEPPCGDSDEPGDLWVTDPDTIADAPSRTGDPAQAPPSVRYRSTTKGPSLFGQDPLT